MVECQLPKRAPRRASADNTNFSSDDSAATSSIPSNQLHDDASQRLADVLRPLADAERQAIVAHVAAMVKLSPAKRAAILTLTANHDF